MRVADTFDRAQWYQRIGAATACAGIAYFGAASARAAEMPPHALRGVARTAALSIGTSTQDRKVVPSGALRLDLPPPPLSFGSSVVGSLGVLGRFGLGGGLGPKSMLGSRPTAPGAELKPLCLGQCMEGAPTFGYADAPLAGFAAVTVGTGLLLALVDTATKQRSFAPTFRLMLTPKRTLTAAVWSF